MNNQITTYDIVKATSNFTEKMLNRPILDDAMKSDDSFDFNKECEKYLDDFEARIELEKENAELKQKLKQEVENYNFILTENEQLKGTIDHLHNEIKALKEVENDENN